jgi:hypothetical protein
MRRLLIVTSFLEGATGLVLIAKPSSVVSVLFGQPLSDPIGIIMTRVAGVALVSLAIACWFSSKNKDAYGLIIALLFYNLASGVLLAFARLHEGLNGMALWPAVATHITMAAWCTILLSTANPHKS